jgi:hypothetical protein
LEEREQGAGLGDAGKEEEGEAGVGRGETEGHLVYMACDRTPEKAGGGVTGSVWPFLLSGHPALSDLTLPCVRSAMLWHPLWAVVQPHLLPEPPRGAPDTTQAESVALSSSLATSPTFAQSENWRFREGKELA